MSTDNNKIKFTGSINNLIKKISEHGWKWKENVGNVSLQISTLKETIFSYYESTGTISPQGKKNNEDIEEMKKIINSIDETIPKSSPSSNSSKKIYIVHGHDETSKTELVKLLTGWGLTPVISQEEPNKNRTILNGVLEDMEDCGYAFVLLTPDDKGYAIKEGESSMHFRARQNVIFEYGILVAKMPMKVALLKKGETQLPTDMTGILYIQFDKCIEDKKVEIKKELLAAGIELNDM